MSERLKYGAIAFGAFALVAASAGSALAASKCAGSNIKITGKTAACLLGLDAKAASAGGSADPTKVAKCKSKLSQTFAKNAAKGKDCISGAADGNTIETKVDNFEAAIEASLAVPTLPNKCQGSKIKLAGKTSACILGLEAKAEGAGGSPDPTKVAKCKSKLSTSFVKSEGKGGCNTNGDADATQTTIDNFDNDVVTELTTAGPTQTLKFTTVPGTTGCGGAGLIPAATAPLSGQLYSDTAHTTPIAGGGLGLGCLYIGGGHAISVPPDQIPDGSSEILGVSGGTLSANAGTGRADCTQGAAATKHCIGADNFGSSCSGDANCKISLPDSCAVDAKCYFGPPLPIPNGGLSTCVLNVIKTDASGTVNASTGDTSISLPLFSRTYLTANATSPCPKCDGTNHCVGGQNPGGMCSPVGTEPLGPTSLDCPPAAGFFLAQLNVDLTPLTSGAASKTASDGNFCASIGQGTNPTSGQAGAFGETTAKAIVENGLPGGDLTDNLGHNAHLASVFCIPMTGNLSIDIAADLPGPGSIGLNGTAQLQ
jgi:hypothetical protein